MAQETKNISRTSTGTLTTTNIFLCPIYEWPKIFQEHAVKAPKEAREKAAAQAKTEREKAAREERECKRKRINTR